MKKSDRTRQDILDATASSLARVGYTATTVKSIAESIGMQDASIYYHFPSKDDLVGEVLDIGTALAERAVSAALDELPTPTDPIVQLRAAMIAHAEAVLNGGDYPRANVRSFGQLPPELAQRHRRGHRDYGSAWRSIIDQGIHDGCFRKDLNPTVAMLLIVGALCWAIEWFEPHGSLSAGDVGAQLFDMVSGGFVAPSAVQTLLSSHLTTGGA